jgi:hypothetical protein
MTDAPAMDNAFMYEQTDVPPGLTLGDWRRLRARRERRTRLASLRMLLPLARRRA